MKPSSLLPATGGRWIIGSSGFLALVVAFFFVTLPYDALQARLLQEISRRTGVTVDARSWSLAWPLGLQWRGLSTQGDRVPSAAIDELTVNLLPQSVVQASPALRTFIRFEDGTGKGSSWIESEVHFAGWSDEVASLRATIDVPDLLPWEIPHVARGAVKGSMGKQWPTPLRMSAPDWLLRGHGELEIRITQLRLEGLPFPQNVLSRVTVERAALRLECQEARCRVLELQGEGPEGTVSGDGTVTLRLPVESSVLALSLTVTPSRRFAQRAFSAGLPGLAEAGPMSFRVTGSLAQPRIGL